ncbi:MAG: polyketide cyclase, partial [Mucinivorans sp.]
PNTLVKVGQGQGGAPFPFTFWIQFKELSCSQTRMRLVLDVELNTMMKMMIGGKLQQALDNIASQIAQGFK